MRNKLSDIAFLESFNRLLSQLDNEENLEVVKTFQTVAKHTRVRAKETKKP